MITRFAVACALGAATILSGGVAVADPPVDDVTYAGGCVAHAFADGPGNLVGDQAWVALTGAVVAYSPTAAHNTVQVDRLVCSVIVNGVQVRSALAGGVGPFAALAPTAVGNYRQDDDFEVCTQVDTTDAHGQSYSQTRCEPFGITVVDYQAVIDLRDELLGQLFPVLQPGLDFAKFLECTTTRAVAPIVINVVLRIDEDGDVYLFGVRLLDCA